MTTYGYARISRKEQNIERQIRNIKAVYPDAVIVSEAFTGTKLEGRKEFEKLLKAVQCNDTIVFDSVSRMSRNADEGTKTYEELHRKGVKLVFLKEPQINTETYDKALADTIPMTGTAVDIILNGVNEYLKVLRTEQIRLAFEQAEKEVTDLRQRTKEGIATAKLNGKQIGQQPGRTLKVKKAAPTMDIIRKHCKEFGGTLNDKDVMQLTGVARNTFYKYKATIKLEEAIDDMRRG